MSSKGLVLITGANGFIAARTVEAFLQKGYSVRGTVRSKANSQKVVDALQQYGDKFELVEVKDITVPGAFDEAVKGVDAIAHLASPVSFAFTDPEPVMNAAINGTLGILESAIKQPTVKHFVLMSSIVAILSPKQNHTFTEADWNTVAEKVVAKDGKDAGGFMIYQASKTAAERALWKFRDERKPSFTVTALNPVLVAGPALVPVPSPDKINESAQPIWDVLAGKPLEQAGMVNGFTAYVDVRDVARFVEAAVAHGAQADGQRYILCAANAPAQSLADILRRAYPERRNVIHEGKPGTGYLPGYAFPEVFGVDGSKASKAFGGYTPWEQTVLDAAKSYEPLL